MWVETGKEQHGYVSDIRRVRHQTYLSRYIINFSASVVCSRMPSAIPRSVLPFSVMLKTVFGRSVPNWPSCMLAIILEIWAGVTLASYRIFVYGDSFQWAKYSHHILLPSLDLTSLNKGSLRRTFWNSLIEFLRTDLDGNLSSTLNPLTASRLDQYLSSLQ